MDILIEITSSVSLASCKTVMDTLIHQMFESGFQSSPYGEGEKGSHIEGMKGLVVEQMRVTDENGQLRVVYPSKLDLQFESIPVDHKS